eukprot:COSAG05_NODE_6909_length_883_cov_1.121173_1_plen_162_part_00
MVEVHCQTVCKTFSQNFLSHVRIIEAGRRFEFEFEFRVSSFRFRVSDFWILESSFQSLSRISQRYIFFISHCQSPKLFSEMFESCQLQNIYENCVRRCLLQVHHNGGHFHGLREGLALLQVLQAALANEHVHVSVHSPAVYLFSCQYLVGVLHSAGLQLAG